MLLLSRMLKSTIKNGTLTLVDVNGGRHVFGNNQAPAVTLRLHDKKLYRSLVFRPELAAGEGYMDGAITFEDGSSVRDLLPLYSINQNRMSNSPLQKIAGRVSRKLRRFQQSNRIGEAQKHIAHHYDIGNDFYKLFLDKNLLYSCAYFESDKDSLEVAQRNKLRLLAAKLNLKADQKVLDIGSGWGDLALYLAQLEDVDVTGVTLSKEQ